MSQNIIWNIPNATPKTGSTASIAAAFIEFAPSSLFSVYIVSPSGEVVDVVASNQTGGAATVWHIPVNFPAGTYQVRVEMNDNSIITPFLAPTSLTVSSGASPSNCTVEPFQTQTTENFAPIQVTLPQAGAIVGLPPLDSTKPGEFNVEYFWKVFDAQNGWPGSAAVFVDVLAIGDAKSPPESQQPSATIVHTSVLPPTVSTKVVPLVIPTVSAVKDFLGPAVVRINYTLSSGTSGSVYSDNFFLGRGCDGKLIGEGSTNSSFTGPSSSSSPGIVLQADTSGLVGILVGSIVGSVVFTTISILLVLWMLRRRRIRRRKQELQEGGGYY